MLYVTATDAKQRLAALFGAAQYVTSYSRVNAFTPELTTTTYCLPLWPK